MTNMIERLERFRFDGKEFNDLEAVKKYVENELGKIIDATPNRLKPDDRLALYTALVANRHRVVRLLTAEYYVDDPDCLQSEKRNILS